MDALMDAVVDSYFPAVDALASELDEIETHIFDPGAGRANVERLWVTIEEAETTNSWLRGPASSRWPPPSSACGA